MPNISKRSFLSLSFIFALLGVAIVSGFYVFAQEGTGIAIRPPTFELTANPGDNLENTIFVDNPSEKTIKVSAEARDFAATGEVGQVKLSEEKTSYSLASWIKISPTYAEIPAKASKQFTFKTSIPLNAEPGGHFGTVIFKIAGGELPEESAGAVLSQEIGSLVLLRVSGEIKEELKIEEFSAPRYQEYGPESFVIRFKNLGNVHVKPQGFITITNLFGKEVGKIQIEQKNVIPGAIRKIEADWNKHYLAGRYTAHLFATYGEKNYTLTAITNFVVFPWKLGLAGFIVLLFIFMARQRIKKALTVLIKGSS